MAALVLLLAALCAVARGFVAGPSPRSAWPSTTKRGPPTALSAVGTMSSKEKLDFVVGIHNGWKSKAVVVEYGNTFCGPCKAMAPKFEALSDEYSERSVFFQCQLDVSEDASALGKREKVSIVPTFQIWKNGEVVEVVAGVKPALLNAAVSRVCGQNFWVAPLARARRKYKKFGFWGCMRKLIRNGFRQPPKLWRRLRGIPEDCEPNVDHCPAPY